MNRAIIIIIVSVVFIGAGYYVSQQIQSEPAPSSTALETSSEGGDATKKFDFASALLNINTITLESDFFKKDPAFRTLTDFSNSLRAPVKGRQNPFAPIDVDLPVSVILATTSSVI